MTHKSYLKAKIWKHREQAYTANCFKIAILEAIFFSGKQFLPPV